MATQEWVSCCGRQQLQHTPVAPRTDEKDACPVSDGLPRVTHRRAVDLQSVIPGEVGGTVPCLGRASSLRGATSTSALLVHRRAHLIDAHSHAHVFDRLTSRFQHSLRSVNTRTQIEQTRTTMNCRTALPHREGRRDPFSCASISHFIRSQATLG